MRKFLFVGIVVALASVAFFATPVFNGSATKVAEANGATVLNHPDGLQCFFSAAGGFYNGPATLVETPSGNVNGQCNATVIAGSPVTSNTKFTAVFGSPFGRVTGRCVLTPSGNGNCNFKN